MFGKVGRHVRQQCAGFLTSCIAVGGVAYAATVVHTRAMSRGVFAVAVLVLVFAAGCSESVNGRACPYGVNSGASNSSSSTSCKVRPSPSDAERAAVLDGSAWRKGHAAFAASRDRDAALVGVGLSRWGDVTFTRATGDGEERLVTYDRAGREAAQDVPDTRGYVEALTDDPFRLGDLAAAGLPKVLARVGRAAQGSRFSDAVFGTTASGAQRRWTVSYVREGGSGLIVLARADGSGVCAFPSPRGDLRRCGAADLLPTDAAEALPATPTADPRLACVKAAGTDAAKLLKCAG